MKKINPESFSGKIYLLIIDKIMIGAIIAIAFVTYDQYKDNLEHTRNIESQKIQLEFERARLSKEFWPVIMDKSNNILVRGYSLQSAVLTKALDSETGVDVSFGLFKDGLSAQDFMRITKTCMPGGLTAFLNNTKEIANQYLEIQQPNGSLVQPTTGESLDSALIRLHNNQAIFRNVISESIQLLGEDSFSVLNNRKFLADNFKSLFFIFKAGSQPDAVQQSRSSLKGIRVIGLINRILFDSNDTAAADEIGRELSIKYNNNVNIQYANSIIEILSKFRIHTLSGNIAIPIAKIVVDSCFKLSTTTTDNEELKAEHYWLEWNAADFLDISMNKFGAIQSEPILTNFIKDFESDLNNANGDESMEKLSTEYESGKIVRRVINIIGTFKTKESIYILTSCSKINENKLRYFPFLKEDIEVALPK